MKNISENKLRYLFTIFTLLIFTGLLYHHTFDASWHYDDAINIPMNNNVHMDTISWDNIVKAMFAGNGKGDVYHPSSYRPTAMLSFALNWYFGTYQVFGYHVVNISIHLLCGIFLFFFIKKTLELPKISSKYSYEIALLSSVLWLVNPVNIQGVTYIVQRMASMASMFYILTLLFYIKGRTENKYWFIGSFIACVLAVGSKENAIILPFVVLLYDMFFIEEMTLKNIKIYIAIFLWMILFAIFFTWFLAGWETFSYDKLMTGYSRREFTLPERLMTESRIMWFYLSLIFWPLSNRLFILYEVPLSTSLIQPITTIISLLCIFITVFWCIYKSKKYPVISFSILFFFINHLIEGTIFPLELIYVHRNYLPSMLIFVPVSILVIKGFFYLKSQYKYALATAITGFIILSGYMAYDQNCIWRKEFYLWVHQVQGHPTPRGFYNLATAYYAQGDFVNMKRYYEIVIKYNEIFGTNHSTDAKCLPEGRTHFQAVQNVRMLDFMSKPGGEGAMQSFYKFVKKTGHDNHAFINLAKGKL